MNRQRLTLALVLVASALSPLAINAGQRVGGDLRLTGNNDVGADRTVAGSVAVWSPQADVVARQRLDGKILGSRRNFSEVEFVGRSSSSSFSRATQRLGGRVVYSRSANGTSHHCVNPMILTVWRLPRTRVFCFYGVCLTVEANAGVGAQFCGAIRTSRGRNGWVARAEGSAQGWGFGNGMFGLEVLGGLVGVYLRAEVDFLNTTVRIDLRASRRGLDRGRVDVHTIGYRLKVQIRAEALFGLVDENLATLVDESGGESSERLALR